jgi:fatty-acyl-CoA synthase
MEGDDLVLAKNAANYVPLTPLSFIRRAADVFPERVAVVHAGVRRTWAATYARCRRLAGALRRLGVVPGDVVAVLGANTPETFEAHFGVPMAGAVLNAINTRLDATTIATILEHAGAKVLIVDREFSRAAAHALGMVRQRPHVIDIDDPAVGGGELLGSMDYEALLATGDPEFAWAGPADEWQAIAVSYTSGTTSSPKGVVYSHRGAYLNALSNCVWWPTGPNPVFLWTLPMFHCNGWCFTWATAAVAGTNVCLRAVRAEPITSLIDAAQVTHLSGAPVVLATICAAAEQTGWRPPRRVHALTGGAAPSASLIERMEALGFEVTHGYGLTETYGPAVVGMREDVQETLTPRERARLRSRQGIICPTLEEVVVADPVTMKPVPRDGLTLGEVLIRGNTVMKGYLQDPAATERSLRGGWLHTEDLAVWHADGWIEIKDRAKDVIISGGENISSVEVEAVLARHPAVLEVAVVARPDPKWGESPCAFVTLKPDTQLAEREMIAFCRQHLAHYKVPRSVVYGPLPKTSTGKIQKGVLRERAKTLSLLI